MNLNAILPYKEGASPADAIHQFHVVIEISAQGPPIKYEFDKASHALCVDRFMSTAMFYPANYGFVPQTLALDGDPVDALVVTPFPLPPGVLICCRALGLLKMEDESGPDAKLIALPTVKICPFYQAIQTLEDLPHLLRDQIIHFFEHYKDLEPKKWVKVQGWRGMDEATQELLEGILRYPEAN